MIAVIDLDPVVHIVSAVQFGSGNHTDVKRVKDHVSQFVNNVIKSSECDSYIMFFQDIGHDNYRKHILPEYKGHRKSSEAIDRWKSPICEELTRLKAVPLYEIESDNALALYVNKCMLDGDDYVVVENDKDLAMLPGKHYNPYKNQPKNKPPFPRFYHFSEAEAMLSMWCQVITGDPTDMPNDQCGIELVGPVKARKALENLNPRLYSAKAMQMYTEKYGISKGLRRMALTYDMVMLLFNPTVDIPETKKVVALKPTPFNDSVDSLFSNEKPSNDLFK